MKTNQKKIVSQRQMAEVLSARFNTVVGLKDISDWMHGRRLPLDAPPFPCPDLGCGWKNTDMAFAWFALYCLPQDNAPSRWFVPPHSLAGMARKAQLQMQIDKAEIVALEVKILKLKLRRLQQKCGV